MFLWGWNAINLKHSIFNLFKHYYKDIGFVIRFCYFNGMLREAEVELVENGSIIVSEMQSKKGVIHIHRHLTITTVQPYKIMDP